MHGQVPQRNAWAAERSVQRVLAKHMPKSKKGEIELLSPPVFVMLAGKISEFKRKPVTKRDMILMRKNVNNFEKRRDILHKAANILKDELAGRLPSPARSASDQWKAAIGILGLSRGAPDDPRSWLSRRTWPAKTMQPWVYMALEIAGILVLTLKNLNLDAPMRRDSVVIKFTYEALSYIGISNLPSLTTISKELTKYID